MTTTADDWRTPRKPYNCPECGRFSRSGWEIVQSEYSAMWGAICSVHGDWQDST